MDAQPWHTIDPDTVDLKLVVSDMDGTLLTSRGDFPDGFGDFLDLLAERGVMFVPSSGRQIYRLTQMFGERSAEMSFIAENGTVVTSRGELVATCELDHDIAARSIEIVRERYHRDDFDVHTVLCGYHGAYIESRDPDFVAEAGKYYAELHPVDDFANVDDIIIKVALWDSGDAERRTYPVFEPFSATHQVTISGAHWIDITEQSASKGLGLASLQERLDITPSQTAVFGDYLNDYSMYDHSELSFAVANAHPDLFDVARYRAPSNDEAAVVTTVKHLLGVKE